MKRDLATIVENNVKFIQQYSFDEWVSKLKLVAIACIPFLSSAKIKEIMDTKTTQLSTMSLVLTKLLL